MPMASGGERLTSKGSPFKSRSITKATWSAISKYLPDRQSSPKRERRMSTITRVYDTYSHADRVVTELETSGIPSKDISIVANKYVSDKYANVEEATPAATGAGLGAAIGGGAGLLAGLGLVAIPGLGPVAAAGWLASTAVGAVAGG